ncbi:hypothetical protein [Breoghania sp.]|uniref:hypothetical protein n=1 Tax=Breoghania sp. TaxID=2065378 RepID=UPI0032047F89
MLDERETIGHGDLSYENLVEANINPSTRLATDYLNHFNEIVMLLELHSDMPECIPDVLAWQPANYADHFMNSNFAAKELAVRAYNAAPAAERGTITPKSIPKFMPRKRNSKRLNRTAPARSGARSHSGSSR